MSRSGDATAPPRKTRSRIQRKNRESILEAALQVFSTAGFKAATIDKIAAAAGMSKPNLLYYFPTKKAIYIALLEDLLHDWLEPLAHIDSSGDPISEIGRYIDAKLEISRVRPEASKLFANEVLHGAPAIREFLRGPLKQLVEEKAGVISRWIDKGRLARVDPYHLIFMIWAVTQHYADFEVQIRAVLGDPDGATGPPIQLARPTIMRLFLEGLKPPLARADHLNLSMDRVPSS